MAKPWVWSTVQYKQGPSNSVKIVQAALNKYASGKLLVDGIYGNGTKAAYQRWQKVLGYSGSDADGLVGPTSLKKLAEKAGFDIRQPPPAPAATAANYQDQPEPPQDMTRVTWGGRTVNKRTAILLDRAESILNHKYDLKLTQGSYNAGGVAASAGTHDGGGAGDIDVSNYTIAQQNEIVQGLRKAGFAAWRRFPPAFAPHIHFEAIGDRDLSSGARSQVNDYFRGDAGLVGSARTEGATHYPNWADKYRP